MLGLLSICEDADLTAMIVPNTLNPKELLILTQWNDVEIPPVAVFIPDLIRVLEVIGALPKTDKK